MGEKPKPIELWSGVADLIPETDDDRKYWLALGRLVHMVTVVEETLTVIVISYSYLLNRRLVRVSRDNPPAFLLLSRRLVYSFLSPWVLLRQVYNWETKLDNIPNTALNPISKLSPGRDA